MENYTRFNRHEIFSCDDRSIVFNAINEVKDRTAENMLFGLFDGYLYESLTPRLKKENFDTKEILNLIEKVKNHK